MPAKMTPREPKPDFREPTPPSEPSGEVSVSIEDSPVAVIAMPTDSEPPITLPDDDTDDAAEPLAATEPRAKPSGRVQVSEEQVRTFLAQQGLVTNLAFGKTPSQWIWQEHGELDTVAPAAARMLTKLARKSQLMRKVADGADALAVGGGTLAYAIRNLIFEREEPTHAQSPRARDAEPAAGDDAGASVGRDGDANPAGDAAGRDPRHAYLPDLA